MHFAWFCFLVLGFYPVTGFIPTLMTLATLAAWKVGLKRIVVALVLLTCILLCNLDIALFTYPALKDRCVRYDDSYAATITKNLQHYSDMFTDQFKMRRVEIHRDLCVERPPVFHQLLYDALVAFRATWIPVMFNFMVLIWFFRSLFGYTFKLAVDRARSRLIAGSKAPMRDWKPLRREFQNMVKFNYVRKQNHTHPVAAGQRTAARRAMQRLAASYGMKIYSYQMSEFDQDHGIEGLRTFHWAKDTGMYYKHDPVTDEHILTFVDVDYYVDMPSILVQYPRNPVMLYTICPESVSSVYDGDIAFTFNKAGEMVMHVVGGAQYTHKIWDWSGDTLKVTSWHTTVCYKVDRRAVGKHRYVVLLTPLAHWKFPWSLFITVQGTPLRQLNPVRGTSLELNVMTPEGMKSSIGRVGEFAETTVKASTAEALMVAARTGSSEMTIATAASYTGDKLSGAKTVDLMRQKLDKTEQTVYPIVHTDKVRNFQLGAYDPEAKPSLKPFGTFLVDACYAPDKTADNMRQAIEGRMSKIPANLTSTDQHVAYINEFITLFFPEDTNLSLVSTDEVWEKQNKKSQRAILAVAEVLGPQAPIYTESFMKAEAYAKVTDPRIISQIPPGSKLDYSKAMYAVTNYMKEGKESYAHWYCFSSYPAEVASRVTRIAERARSSGINTDMSRFDGHMGYACRLFEKMVLLRMFSADKALVMALHDAQYGIPGVTSYGQRYITGYHRLSGSPETSIMNSLVNALISYTAKRMVDLPPKQAYAEIGIVGGDDGFTTDVPAAVFIKAAEFWGHEVKPVVIRKGDTGVEFLARIYGPEVWYGNPSSMCQPKRQLSKFFTTRTLPPGMTPLEKLYVKAYAYYLTDRCTPVLGKMVTAIVSKLKVTRGKVDEILTKRPEAKEIAYSTLNAKDDVQFPNDYGEWMEDVFEKDLPAFDDHTFNRWLRSVSSPRDFLKAPVCWTDPTPPQPPVQATVAEQVIPGPPITDTVVAPITHAEKLKMAKKAENNLKPAKIREVKQKLANYTKAVDQAHQELVKTASAAGITVEQAVTMATKTNENTATKEKLEQPPENKAPYKSGRMRGRGHRGRGSGRGARAANRA